MDIRPCYIQNVNLSKECYILDAIFYIMDVERKIWVRRVSIYME